MIDYTKIRPDMIEALKRYIDHGIPPGHFLSAVICNDLKEACARADSDNQKALFEITAWLYNYAPANCWGSEARMRIWINSKQRTLDGKESSALS
jgi:hypothetical protein